MSTRSLPSRMRRLSMVTQTTELVIEPQIRRFPVHRYRGAALGVLVLVLASILAVGEIARMEPVLAAQGANAARAVLYELPVGGELRVPIEPDTDVIRFVVHAYRRGELLLSPRAARLVVSAKGDKGARTETLDLAAPGLGARVTSEDSGLSVGDPSPFEIDVHDIGVGELTLNVDRVDEADGLLVRAYRREQLSSAEAALRDTVLARPRKEELARWAWELGWDELMPFERAAILRTRWRKLGASSPAGELRSVSVAISPPSPRELAPRHEELVGRVALRGDERVALVLHPGARLRIAADESTQLHLAVRDANGESSEWRTNAYAEIGPFPGPRSVEAGVDREVLIEVRAPSADDVEWLGWNDVYRATAQTPVVVQSPDASRVLRVTVRRPMDRTDAALARLDARVDVSGPSTKSTSQTFRSTAPRSRVDRYEDFDPPEAPSEPAAFYVTLRQGMTARIAPLEGALDMAIAELDETIPAIPLPTRLADAPPLVLLPKTERPEDAPRGFVPRRPSNAAAFEPAAHKVVRTARWFAPAPTPPAVALGHVKHGTGARGVYDAEPFEALGESLELDSDNRRPLYLPLTAVSDTTTSLTIQLEQDANRLSRPGLHARWTAARTVDVKAGEPTRTTFVIGDDIPPGRLRVRITPAYELGPSDGSDGRTPRVFVHLPWAAKRPFGPRWIAGAFEE